MKYLLHIFILIPMLVLAQGKSITGTVVDNQGAPLLVQPFKLKIPTLLELYQILMVISLFL